jgi:peptide/nickel transport system permease protein
MAEQIAGVSVLAEGALQGPSAAQPGRRGVKRALASRQRVRVRPIVAIATLILVVAVVAALFPGLFGSGSPYAINPDVSLQAPSLHHLFGTDEIGRDVYARVVYGARDSMYLGFLATIVAVLLGTLLGLLGGLSGRRVDAVVSRVVEVMFAFPAMLLAMIVIVTFGTDLFTTSVAIGIALAPALARLVRSQALVVRDSGYVESARILGHSRARIVLATIAPNALRPLLSFALLQVGAALIWGMTLNFLGFGARPPYPSWGEMLSESENFLSYCWWLPVFPGAAVVLVAASSTVLGRYLQGRLAGRR